MTRLAVDRPASQAWTRRGFLTAGAAAAAAPLLLRGSAAWAGTSSPAGLGDRALADEGAVMATPSAFGFPEPDMTSRIVKDITFPHEGTRSWTDTYGACRDGCSRLHEGQDLMGTKLQKLVACVDGTIVELRHRADGNSLYLRGDDGWYYAYLHINNDSPGTDDGANPFAWAFAPGMATGVTVRRGQHVAYMGDSGNAESTAAHLHFEMRKPADSVWNAQAVNARYSLDASRPPPPAVAPETYTPWGTAADYIRQQYLDVLGRAPYPAALVGYVDLLETGAHSPQWVTQHLVESSECQSRNGAALRMYRAFFGRDADEGGYLYWLSELRAGHSLGSIAERLARTGEFTRNYSSLGNGAFVDAVYGNVLDRAPDAGGRTFWADRLDRGLTRGQLMLRFSESSENQARLALPVAVTIIHTAMLGRMPSPTSIASWHYRVASPGGSVGTMIDTLRRSDEYRRRFF